ncbi:MAG: 4-(cytidine 5'-diphospho)-2-C-methyl-D-erythritol kinase, partial [Oscillospiraceae bacterium]|nr:4-(cytidine 5'-diphospho)-2-C-methyl-D-erythritol kinase [Oscillospiraceae bacterium]
MSRMLTQTIREKAYGKLNLSLDVLGKRPDGYHEMLMLMQSVSLCDDVTILISEGDGKIGASTNRSYIPNTDKNLGFK